MDDKDIHNDPLKDAPILSSLKNGDFRSDVPEAYFESMTDEVMKKLREVEAGGESRQNAWNLLAAAIILLGSAFAIYGLLSQDFNPQEEYKLTWEDVSTEDILDELNAEEMDVGFVSDVMGDEALAAALQDGQFFDDEFNDYEEEYLQQQDEQYDLLLEDMETEDINNEMLDELLKEYE